MVLVVWYDHKIHFWEGNLIKKNCRLQVMKNTHYLTFEFRVLYTCQNLKLKVPLGYKFPKDSGDT